MNLTIQRPTWRTGGNSANKTGSGDTKLLNNTGFRCCLGILSQALGLPDSQLLGVSYPVGPNFTNTVMCVPNASGNGNTATPFTNEATAINDNGTLTSADREAAIATLFGSQGISVEFAGSYN